jgi:N-acetylglutamate synthase/N-acetylornithine aminotransferase
MVTLLSIVYSDTSMSQGSLYTILNNVTTKTYVTGIPIYNTQQCNHQNLCLLSIVYSDTCDIGFGDYIVEYCI